MEPAARRMYRQNFSIPYEELTGLAEYIERTIRASVDELPIPKLDSEGYFASPADAGIELERFVIEELYAQRLRYGFVLALYAVVEDRLNKMCEFVSDYTEGIVLSYRDTRELARHREGIDRARAFLEGVLKWSFPDNEWAEIQKLRTLRNVIVHQDGYDADKKVSPERDSLVSLDPSWRVRIEANYCETAGKKARALFDKLQELNRDKIERILDLVMKKVLDRRAPKGRST